MGECGQKSESNNETDDNNMWPLFLTPTQDHQSINDDANDALLANNKGNTIVANVDDIDIGSISSFGSFIDNAFDVGGGNSISNSNVSSNMSSIGNPPMDTAMPSADATSLYDANNVLNTSTNDDSSHKTNRGMLGSRIEPLTTLFGNGRMPNQNENESKGLLGNLFKSNQNENDMKVDLVESGPSLHKDDDDLDKVFRQMTNQWKNGKGGLFDFKHDEDGNLIFGDKKVNPKDNEISEDLEKVHARDLYNMTAQEREAVYNEIHGVESRCIQENKYIVSSALHQMRREIDDNLDQELESDKGDNALFTKKAYIRALELQSDYIQSDDFRIRFLRAELFDVQRAALRYFRRLDVLYDLFGDVGLTRPLFLSDLTKRELQYLRAGQHQIFPSRDRTGRRIFSYQLSNNSEYSVKERVRTKCYLFETLAQDEMSQKKGIVWVGFIQPSHYKMEASWQTIRQLKRSALSCPLRRSAFHFCLPNSFVLAFIRALVKSLFERQEWNVFRMHSGSAIENNYKLTSFGIPANEGPITYNGKVKTKNIVKFIQARKRIEMLQKQQIAQLQSSGGGGTNYRIPSCPIIECPDQNCVVFGDKSLYDHPPNVRFRRFVMDREMRRLEQIANCDTSVAVSVAEFVNGMVNDALSQQRGEQGLRFYAYEKGCSVYHEITDRNDLHKRFLQALRDVRKRSRDETGMLPGQICSVMHQQQQQRQGQHYVSADATSILGINSYKRTKTCGESLCSC